MYRRLAGLGLLGLGVFVQPPAHGRASAGERVACDSLVKARGSDPLSYRQRDDRCEGVYAQNVAGSSGLLVASLVESFERIDDTSSRPLRIEWTATKGDAVSLRAYSIKSGLYYRMETVHPIAASPYVWPVAVLRALKIGNTDIGVVGSTQRNVGGARRDVFVPVRIGQQSAPARATSYRVTVWPSVELNDVFVTLASVGADGKPATYLQRDENIQYGFYPAERGVDIRLKALTTPGVYFVRVAATLKHGGSATTSFLLFHAGK